MRIKKRLYFNSVYKSEITDFTWDNVAETEATITCAYEPPISSGVGSTSPFILKAGDLAVVSNLVFTVVTAIINPVDGVFVIEATISDDVLHNRRDPIVGDLLYAVQANTDTSDYDNILSSGYYSVTDNVIVSEPYLDVFVDYTMQSENAYFGSHYTTYNSKQNFFVNIIGANKHNYQRLGVGNLGSHQLNKILITSPQLVLSSCDGGLLEKVAFNGEDSVVYNNGEIRQSFNLRLIQ